MSKGKLILLATPIGNLSDAPPRLGEAIASCDVVYAEDSRRSRILLDRLGVTANLRSYFAGNEAGRAKEVAARLDAGETVGLVTDAGTPSVADPGYSAVQAALEVGATVTVVPGPSAVTAAVAVSGLPADRFVFEGFLPRKGAARSRRLDALATEPRTIVLFAAPSRLGADLEDLAEVLGADRKLAVARELTKVYEEVWRGTLEEAVTEWVEPRGEFTLVVAGAPDHDAEVSDALPLVDAMVAAGVPLSEAVRTVAEETGTRRRRLYEAALRANR